jgi:hypothetical protein
MANELNGRLRPRGDDRDVDGGASVRRAAASGGPAEVPRAGHGERLAGALRGAVRLTVAAARHAGKRHQRDVVGRFGCRPRRWPGRRRAGRLRRGGRSDAYHRRGPRCDGPGCRNRRRHRGSCGGGSGGGVCVGPGSGRRLGNRGGGLLRRAALFQVSHGRLCDVLDGDCCRIRLCKRGALRIRIGRHDGSYVGSRRRGGRGRRSGRRAATGENKRQQKTEAEGYEPATDHHELPSSATDSVRNRTRSRHKRPVQDTGKGRTSPACGICSAIESTAFPSESAAPGRSTHPRGCG